MANEELPVDAIAKKVEERDSMINLKDISRINEDISKKSTWKAFGTIIKRDMNMLRVLNILMF